jgi:hypothetical protein
MVNQTATLPMRDMYRPVSGFHRSGEPITSGQGHVFDMQVANVRLKPGESRQVLIGSSNSPVPPKGFSIEVKPMKMPAGTVISNITTEGSSRRYDYILDIANLSDRSINAQIWQM